MQTFKNLLALGFKLHLSHTMNKKSTNNWKPLTPLYKAVKLHTSYILQSSECLDHARVFICRFKQLLIKLVSVLRISTPLHLQRRSGYVILSEQPVYFRPEAKYSIIKTLRKLSYFPKTFSFFIVSPILPLSFCHCYDIFIYSLKILYSNLLVAAMSLSMGWHA